MGEEETLSGVQPFNLCHFCIRQRKIKDVKVFLHAFLVCGFRDNDHIFLQQEPLYRWERISSHGTSSSIMRSIACTCPTIFFRRRCRLSESIHCFILKRSFLLCPALVPEENLQPGDGISLPDSDRSPDIPV